MRRYGWLVGLLALAMVLAGCEDSSEPAEQLGVVGQAAESDYFVTRWEGTEVTIKVIPSAFITSAYNYEVDWEGDGTFDETFTGTGDDGDADATHSYVGEGPHTVWIRGSFPAIQMGALGVDCSGLKAVEQWGSIGWESFSKAFKGCDKLSIEATDYPDLSAVANMESAFRNVPSFNSSISFWDVRYVQNMSWMFANSGVNQDLGAWDTGSVTNLSAVFYKAASFGGDVSTWDTSSVTNMAQMFRDAAVFNEDVTPGPGGVWDMSNVVDISYMFSGAKAFNQPVNSWDTSSVVNMERVFNQATAFNQPLDNWDMGQVTSTIGMFALAENFDQNISGWFVDSQSPLTDVRWMFQDAKSFNQPLNTWKLSNVTDMRDMFNGATSFNQPINNWSTSNVTDMQYAFMGATSFNQSLGGWDTSSVTNMSHMFHGATLFNGDISSWNTGAVTDMSSMFEIAAAFSDDISSWNTGNVLNMSKMFSGADNFDADVSGWSTGSVTDMSYMFADAGTFNSDVTGWNTSSVTNMNYMFEEAYAFNRDLGGWDIGNVASMTGMLSSNGMTPASYDQTLSGWETLPNLQSGVTIGVTGLEYCDGAAARQSLIDNFSWNFSGDNADCCGNGIVDGMFGEICDDGLNNGMPGSCSFDCFFHITECYPDEDNDTYGDMLASPIVMNTPVPGVCTGNFSTDNFDCDDGTLPSDCGANCYPGNPDPDICDGFDQNCDGTLDEDFAPGATSCGIGACSDSGTTTCLGGAIVDSCTPGTPAASDATCDGIDNDCNGSTDEDYLPTATNCGLGVCSDAGTLSCVSGVEEDSCTVGTPTGSDTNCNGLDENCSGTADENYTSSASSCGVGACASAGTLSCSAGTETDSCTPGTPAANDASCDGVDDDCDGQVDEDYVPVATSCGDGACSAGGMTSCVGGSVQDSCTAGTPASDDATCDGVDDDCDGQADEDYVSTGTSCGEGACGAAGTLICVSGVEQDDCSPGTPASNDASCNGVDDDCNGQVDEDYSNTPTSCGVGACRSGGELTCVAGSEVNTCAVGTPAANDATCDGIDDDCDGSEDEDYVASATSCGQGACQGSGILACIAGVEEDSCATGTPGSTDASCDGVDDDCDTEFDEDYPGGISNCGVGACSSTGTLTCVAGGVQDDCTPGTPAANDATCDGIDDDCDGQIDEDYVSTATSCGVGACGSSGTLSCVAGVEEDSCAAGTPAANDTTCDGIDDDCDGTEDEDYVQSATSCGVGACGAAGTLSCVSGAEQDSCAAGTPAANDATCDGLDDDCDGTEDEDYVQTATSCGVGACGAAGTLSCVSGAEQDSCAPGTPAANDATCDLVDDDCDSDFDEDAVGCFTCSLPSDCPALGNDCREYTCPDGVCLLGDVASGVACDDGAFCTATDTCDGAGSCSGAGSPCSGGSPFCQEGTSECVECRTSADCPASGNECQFAVCTAGVCGFGDRPLGTTCTSDDNACNGPEQCLDDLGTIQCQANGESPCDQDGNSPACIDEGNDINSCVGSCGDGKIGVGEVCDRAGLNTDDANAGGCSTSCELNTGWRCPGGTPTCTNPEPICGDGIVIGTREVCDAGSAINGTTECGCTATCTFVAQATTCDDGLYCNGVDTCNGSGVCGQHSGSPCALGAAACREDSDTCDECLNSAQCDNGLACDGTETCDIALGLCTDGPDLTCSGDFICDDNDGSCGCPSGQAETDPNTCEPIQCSADEDCDDNNVCNGSETCNTGTSQCISGTPLTCGNSLACDGVETCDPVNGCETGNPVTCSAKFECIEPGGTCESKCGNGTLDQDEDCDDGTANSDTAADACRTNCQLPTCGDGVLDSAEQCDDDNQQVGDGCSANCMTEECITVADCDAVTECQTVNCTDGSCFYNDKSQGVACTDDGVFCSGAERCDGAGACGSSGSPCGNPSAPLCDEDLTSCVACLVAADCDDGVFCNGEESCDGTGACTSGTPVTCQAGFTCDAIEDSCVTLCGNGICDSVETVVSCSADCATGGTDTDGDGVSDAKEEQFGTDPNLKDSDGDSIEDGIEIGDVANPRNTDGDELIDALDDDDDNDGILSLFEDVDDDGDLFDEDDDADSIPNFRDADDDGDGVPTRIEAFGTKPSSVGAKALPDGLLDSDEDGIPNFRDKDDDGDTILTANEVQGQGNAWQLDTDKDGIPNYVDEDDDGDTLLTADEVAEASGPDFDEDGTPNYLDEDDDGLLDGDEVALGTSLINDDTDNDGLLDGEEVEFNADPLNEDTDDDGLLDGDEVHVYQTNVRNPDTDNDGLSDGDEVFVHKTSPSERDSDNDGVSDGDEVALGSNPNDDLSVPIANDAAGGAGAGGCSSLGSSPWTPGFVVFGMLALGLLRRGRVMRRKR